MSLRPRYPFTALVALVVAFALWYAVAGQRREKISERQAVVPLTLSNVPRDLVITNNVPESVSLRLRGALSRELNPSHPIEVVLDLSDAQPGVRTYPIKESEITLPPNVSVVAIDPPEIRLRIERLATKAVPVHPVTEGTPAPGYVLAGVRAVPAVLGVQGPESVLKKLNAVETTPVSIEGAVTSVEAAVQVRLPHPLLRLTANTPILLMADIVPAPTPTPAPRRRQRRRPRRRK